MTAFRARSARALVLSTVTAFVTVQPASLRAQSNAAPAYNAAGDPSAAQPQQESAVKRALEKLYRKEGRPVPAYLNNQPVNNAAMSQSAPGSSMSNGGPGQQGEPTMDESRPPAPRRPSAFFGRSRQAVQQQSPEYYGGQVRQMPPAQFAGSRQGTAYEQSVSVDESAQMAAQRPAANAKPRLIDRMNPFRRFSRSAKKENEPTLSDSNVARHQPSMMQQPSMRQAPQMPQPTAAMQSEPTISGPRAQMAMQPDRSSPRMSITLQPAPVANIAPPPPPPPAPPAIGMVPPAPSESLPEFNNVPPSPSAVPLSPSAVPPAPVAAAATPGQGDASIPIELGANKPLDAAPVASRKPQIDLTPHPKPKTQTDEVPNPFKEVSEREADRTGDPFTGLKLEDEPTAPAGRASIKSPLTESTPSQMRPSEARPSEAQPSEARPTESRSSEARPSEAVPTRLPSRTQDSQAPAKPPTEPSRPDETEMQPKSGSGDLRSKGNDTTDVRPRSENEVPPEPTEKTEVRPKPADASGALPPKVFSQSRTATHLPGKTSGSDSKMRKIAERVGQKGMKGFCPVALRDRRQLVDADPSISLVFQGHQYWLSTSEAQAAFERNPEKYAPVAGGVGIVVKASSDQVIEGVLDYAVWYRDRLYLFNSPESMEAFSLSPESYAAPYRGQSR